MDFFFKQRVQRRLQEEQGVLYKAGARFHIGLVYPNQYFFGMSNLGFQALYRIFNEDTGVSCERYFLPEADLTPALGRGSLVSYEGKTPSEKLDLLAFSISYQNDYLNLIPLFHLLGLPHGAADREARHPLVIAGGPAVTINPEPIAPMMDAMILGEGEEVAEEILEILKSGSKREEQISLLSRLEGVYVPALFENPYYRAQASTKATRGFGLISGRANGPEQGGNFIKRRVVQDPQKGLAHSTLLSRDTEFADLYLLEVQRGCQWGCRFCAAGFMYRYPRYDKLEDLKRRIDLGLQYRNKVGLIAGDLLGHEEIHEVLDYIDEKGGAFSPSSVRLDAFTPRIIHHLKKSGNRSIAIAPEAGSERLRRSLNKTFTQDQVVQAALQLAEGGIQNIKLYIMVGLPTETESDLEELCRLTQETRRALVGFAKNSGRMPALTLSMSPFVPKPSTPLQYAPFAGMGVIKDRLQKVRGRLLNEGHIRISGESALSAHMETLLSRGDRQVLDFLEKAVVPRGKGMEVGNAGHLKRVLRQLDFSADRFVLGHLDPQEPSPWDFIDHGIKKSFFQRELDKFSRQRITHHCMPEICRSCGVC